MGDDYIHGDVEELRKVFIELILYRACRRQSHTANKRYIYIYMILWKN